MELLITAILAFASTNIDDLFILTLFFGDRQRRTSDIVIGQLLGITTLIFISLIGSLIGLLIDIRYVGLLGLVPCYLGIQGAIRLWKLHQKDNLSSRGLTEKRSILAVAGVTIANGGDNIGIYIPLFAALTWPAKITTVTVFLAMTLVWCASARYLANHPWLEKNIDRYGHWITPVVLFLLGIFILKESNTLGLFY
jgi:cadmium resistance transport/sequestration family protein